MILKDILQDILLLQHGLGHDSDPFCLELVVKRLTIDQTLSLPGHLYRNSQER